MPLWRRDERWARLRRERFGAALMGLLLLGATVNAQSSAPKTELRKTSAHRSNELTLAGLRPGRDTASRAIQLYRKPTGADAGRDAPLVWTAACRTRSLSIDVDATGAIQVIRTAETSKPLQDCRQGSPLAWKTGRGLRIGDRATRVTALYGAPDSKSPSTRDGQQLELMYYAFDWAGQDVPQVMEVVCTAEKDGVPGQVVEITLAAPSL